MSDLLLVSSFLHPRGGDTTLLFAEWAGWRARGGVVVPFAMRHPDNVPAVSEARFPPWHAPRQSQSPVQKAAAALRATWNLTAARALDDLLRDHPVAAAHVHHLHRHLTPSILPVLRRHGVRVVWTVHDYDLVCPNAIRYREGAPCARCTGGHYAHAVAGRCKDGHLGASLAVAVEHAVHRRLRLHRWVDAFVAPSAAVAQALVEDGLPQAKVHHLPNLLSVTTGERSDATDVLFAGRLTDEKGTREVLALARALPGATVVVLGDGPLRPLLESAALPNLRVRGAATPRDVAAALAGARVAVVPSRWPENQPYAVLEAQAAGAAVVASRVGGIPEIVADGEDGVLVPPGDVAALVAAVSRLLGDDGTRRRLVDAARNRVATEREPSGWFAAMARLLWPGARHEPTSIP